MSVYLPEPVSPFTTDAVKPPLPLDGFKKRDEVEKEVKNVPAGQPVFALILGGSGTGRSAAARYILDQYRDTRKINAPNFIIPDDVTPNDSGKWTLCNWLLSLQLAVQRKGVIVDPTLFERVETLAETVKDRVYVGKYVQCIADYVKELKPNNLAFGLCLENIPTWEIVDDAVKIFRNTDVPCVFTIQDAGTRRSDIFDPFAAIPHSTRISVDLGFLTADDVADFADQHWTLYGKGHPPFDTNGIKLAFGKLPKMRELPIGRARTILGNLHDLKTLHDEHGPTWGEKKITDTLKKMIIL